MPPLTALASEMCQMTELVCEMTAPRCSRECADKRVLRPPEEVLYHTLGRRSSPSLCMEVAWTACHTCSRTGGTPWRTRWRLGKVGSLEATEVAVVATAEEEEGRPLRTRRGAHQAGT